MIDGIYRLMAEMADKVSERRQSANSFYLSINTAIIGLPIFYSQEQSSSLSQVLLCLSGVIICAIWRQSILSYKSLNQAKFEVLHKIEESLPLSPYKLEWEALTSGERGKRHAPFYTVEIKVPWVFGALHLAQMAPTLITWFSACSWALQITV